MITAAIINLLMMMVGIMFWSALSHRIQEYRSLKFRYTLYSLRDRLAHCVYDGHIREDSKEYAFIVETLNSYICRTDRATLTAIVERHFAVMANDTYYRKLKRTILHCRTQHPEVAAIMDDFECTVVTQVCQRSTLIRFAPLWDTLLRTFCSASRIAKKVHQARPHLEDQRKRVLNPATG